MAVSASSAQTVAPARDLKVGLVAGWGRYPALVARALRQAGYQVYTVAVRGHAQQELAELSDEIVWVGLAQLGKARRFFRRHQVRQLTMAGKIHKVVLFRPGALWQLRPDWRGLCRFWSYAVTRRMDGRDDTLLSAVLTEFCLDGGQFHPATDFAPELLVQFGLLTRRGPSKAELADIEFGWQMAKEMGRLDIGQAVAVCRRSVLAVEAIEGTDECIRRAGQLCRRGGFTVVKVAKPQQDMRFDVPTIGVGTLETMLAAGGRVLAVEDQKTILLDEPAVRRFADQKGLTIVALKADGVCPPQWTAAASEAA